jgi:hypothetical protein
VSLVFAASSFNKLDEDLKEYLFSLYYEYYKKTYGNDPMDVFLKVTKTNINNYIMHIKDTTINYKNVIKDLSDDIIVMLIYDSKLNLIGCSRIKEKDSDVRVLDIVFDNLGKIIERKNWVEVVAFLENFYKSRGYNKMYLNIPLKDGPLLVRANELGFKENPDDIEIDAKTYVLNKLIGSKKNE